MKKAKTKFLIGSLIITVTLVALAATGFQESKAYYLHVDEVYAMGNDAFNKRLKVRGDVVEGSIQTDTRPITFTIELNGATMPVRYIGTAPIPDTFKDGSQAVVEGKLLTNGTFEADHIQAKCASKYEGEGMEGGA
ncbi:MAG: cytochrome c maturation protein CcmE [Gemmatimonadetes bacterium]|nr:MAG: cytochrome c maturation protein CcmE [Gemmatimonadota bacterium]